MSDVPRWARGEGPGDRRRGVTRRRLFGPAARDGLARLWIGSAALIVFAAFAAILADGLVRGGGQLSLDFLTRAPQSAGRAGGIAPVLVSTALILLVCLAASVPLAVGTAVLLSEFSRDARLFGRLVRRSLDVLAGLPSIVFGLFGYAFFCHALGLGFSILSGGLTLACMVLPIMIRTLEVALRAVPDEIREASAALGFSRISAIRNLVLPAAAPGIAAGVVLGTGRALAETAALLFTSGTVLRMPSSFHDSGRAISVHVYDLAMNVSGGDAMAHASALVLLVSLISTNAITTMAIGRWQKRMGWLHA